MLLVKHKNSHHKSEEELGRISFQSIHQLLLVLLLIKLWWWPNEDLVRVLLVAVRHVYRKRR